MDPTRFRNAILAAATVLAVVTTTGLGALWSSSASARCTCAPPPARGGGPAAGWTPTRPNIPTGPRVPSMGPIRPPIINPGIRAGQTAATNAGRQAANRTGPNSRPPAEGGVVWESFDEEGGDWGTILDGIARIEDRRDEGAEWISFDGAEGSGSDDAERDGYRGSWFPDDAMTEEEFGDADFPDFELPGETDAEFSEADLEGLDEGFHDPDPELIAQLERELSEAIAEGNRLDWKVFEAKGQYYIVKGGTFVIVALLGGAAFQAAVEGSYGLYAAYLGGRAVATQIKATNDPSPHPDKRGAHFTAWAVTETAEIGAEFIGELAGGQIGRQVLGLVVEGGLELVNADDELTTALQGRNSTLRRSVGLRPVQ